MSQTAALLHRSWAQVGELLDAGAITFRAEGSRRRIDRDDVLAFRAAEAATRREALEEVTRISEEFEGGYQ